MSYRHTSYRKMSAVVKRSREPGATLTRSEMDRVLHWSNLGPLPKPTGWGRPSRVWERRPGEPARAA